MTRWEPNARGRLGLAALELYSERGYDQTTVGRRSPSARASPSGPSSAYFADKREVLFHGSGMPPGADRGRGSRTPRPRSRQSTPVGAALEGGPLARFDEVPRLSRCGARPIVAANAELQERELIKLAALATAPR